MSLFEPKQRSCALFLDGGNLQLLELRKSGSNVTIAACSSLPISRNVMSSDQIIDSAQLTRLLRQAYDQPQFGKFTTHRVRIAVPDAKAFMRIIDIPEAAADNPGQAVLFEAEGYIPMPLEQLYTDWESLPPETKMQNKVLLTAAPIQYIDNLLKVVIEAGLRPIHVEVASLSLARVLAPEQKQKLSLTVYIQENSSAATVMRNGVPWFSATIPAGLAGVYESVANTLTVSRDEAIQIIFKNGLKNTTLYPNMSTATRGGIENLANEIKKIIGFYEKRDGVALEQLFLTGVAEYTPGLIEALQAALPITETLKEVSVLPRAVTLPSPTYKDGRVPLFSVVVGLSLHRTEHNTILPQQYKADLGYEKWYGRMKRVLALGTALVLLISLARIGGYIWLQQKKAGVENEIQRIRQKNNQSENNALRDSVKQANTYILEYSKLQESMPQWSGVLQRIAQHVPAGVKINNVQLRADTGEVQIIGQSPTRELVIELYNNILKDTEYFKDIDYPLENVAKATDVSFYYNFKVQNSVLTKSGSVPPSAVQTKQKK